MSLLLALPFLAAATPPLETDVIARLLAKAERQAAQPKTPDSLAGTLDQIAASGVRPMASSPDPIPSWRAKLPDASPQAASRPATGPRFYRGTIAPRERFELRQDVQSADEAELTLMTLANRQFVLEIEDANGHQICQAKPKNARASCSWKAAAGGFVAINIISRDTRPTDYVLVMK